MVMHCEFCGHELTKEQEKAELERREAEQKEREIALAKLKARTLWQEKYCPEKKIVSFKLLLFIIVLWLASFAIKVLLFAPLLPLGFVLFLEFYWYERMYRREITESKTRFLKNEPDKYEIVFGQVRDNPL